jgi:murein DD-endopeptidase MepM/ murein hydrolase activator NlpD
VTTEALNSVAPPPSQKDAKAAAQQLEAFFLRRMLAEARPKGAGMLDGGFAGDTFKDMLDEAIADRMAKAGGLGMAEMFSQQLGSKPVDPVLAPYLENRGVALAAPVPGGIGSGFGPRVGHSGEVHQHQGLDLHARQGDPVASAAPGTVSHAGPAGTYGNLVIVKHEGGYSTRYAHLSTVGVAVGDKVTAGQRVGEVGSTGLSDGPHLHFEVRKGDQAIDPTALLPLNGSRGRTSR